MRATTRQRFRLSGAISELLDRLAVGPRYIYVHDVGAPPALHIAMHAPEQVYPDPGGA